MSVDLVFKSLSLNTKWKLSTTPSGREEGKAWREWNMIAS